MALSEVQQMLPPIWNGLYSEEFLSVSALEGQGLGLSSLKGFSKQLLLLYWDCLHERILLRRKCGQGPRSVDIRSEGAFLCVQLVAEKAVPVTETVTEEHLKPFIKEHAGEIREGVQQLTEQGIIPNAEEIRDNLPEAAEKFTEETLKPAAQQLSEEIQSQVICYGIAARHIRPCKSLNISLKDKFLNPCGGQLVI